MRHSAIPRLSPTHTPCWNYLQTRSGGDSSLSDELREASLADGRDKKNENEMLKQNGSKSGLCQFCVSEATVKKKEHEQF